MRSVLVLIIGFLLGIAVITMKTGAPSLPITPSVNAADGSVEQGSDKPFGPEDLLAEAEVYDHEADIIQAEVMQYKRRAAAMTSTTDPKGFRRAAMTTAAQSKSKAVAELRQLAAHHRAEANRMTAKQSSP
ncbi:MAG: hypothetical protein P0111_12080 [Nitrospira sp.]|nr:hypothetical protein [Nitrospira sp.]